MEAALTGAKGPYDVPIGLKLFGSSDRVEQLALKQRLKDLNLPISELVKAERARIKAEQEMAKHRQADRKKLLKEAAKGAGGVRRGGGGTQFEASSQQFANITVSANETAVPSMDEILSNATSFDPRAIGEMAEKYGTGEEALSQLPFADQPPALLTKLLPHQLQGLAWLIDRENPTLPPAGSSDIVQLWKRSMGNVFTNVATNYTLAKPRLASGGILADDMGVGKTLQIISLLLADPARTKQPTLIVCPLSVMSNWSGQIRSHVRPEHGLKVLIYHGDGKKSKTPEDYAQYDAVVTTYHTVALEWMPSGVKSGQAKPIPRSHGLFSVEWRRVVLDEGHIIRNPKTKMAQAACALLSRSRWILTGTPIINNLKDLQSHVKFIRLSGGLEQPEIFSSTLIRPLKQGASEARIILQALMSTICLRRMKDMKFIDLRLPELSSHKYTVAFRPHEREKYEAFQAEAKGLLIQHQTRTNAQGVNTYSHLLEVLLRMRQTCNHWKLCGERVTKLLSLVKQNTKIKLTPENVASLQELLQLNIESQEDCAVCLETLHNPVITACAHVFGGECIERVIEVQHKCPMCRAELETADDLVKPAVEKESGREADVDLDSTSSKVEALVNILTASRKAVGTKTIVFSQWTSFLDIIQHQLTEKGFKFCRLDGTMTSARRDGALSSLADDPECTIMLASLAVCSVGLNLVAANQVILADSWWAPAIEDQAIDRVHRLGQTRPTTVFRLVMEDSIEERVLEIQQEKRSLMMTAFGEKTTKRGKEQASRMADIVKLLGR